MSATVRRASCGSYLAASSPHSRRTALDQSWRWLFTDQWKQARQWVRDSLLRLCSNHKPTNPSNSCGVHLPSWRRASRNVSPWRFFPRSALWHVSLRIERREGCLHVMHRFTAQPWPSDDKRPAPAKLLVEGIDSAVQPVGYCFSGATTDVSQAHAEVQRTDRAGGASAGPSWAFGGRTNLSLKACAFASYVAS